MIIFGSRAAQLRGNKLRDFSKSDIDVVCKPEALRGYGSLIHYTPYRTVCLPPIGAGPVIDSWNFDKELVQALVQMPDNQQARYHSRPALCVGVWTDVVLKQVMKQVLPEQQKVTDDLRAYHENGYFGAKKLPEHDKLAELMQLLGMEKYGQHPQDFPGFVVQKEPLNLVVQ